jgi:hypothetical protein
MDYELEILDLNNKIKEMKKVILKLMSFNSVLLEKISNKDDYKYLLDKIKEIKNNFII